MRWFKKKEQQPQLTHEETVDAVLRLIETAIYTASQRSGGMPAQVVAQPILRNATPEWVHQQKSRLEMEVKSGATSRFQDAWRYLLDSDDWSRYSHSFESYITEGFQNSTAAHKGIHLIASSVSTLDWYVTDANGERLSDSDEISQILKRPNPFQSGADLVYELQAYKTTCGNSYLRAVKSEGNNQRQASKPLRLRALPAHKVEIKESSVTLNPVEYRWTLPDNKKILSFPVDSSGRSDILHLLHQSLSDGPYGLSKIAVALQNILINNTSDEWNLGLLRNGARPSGVLHVDQKLTVEQLDMLREEIDRTLSGSHVSGRPLLLGKGMSFTEAQLTPKDMDYKESQIFSIIQIGNALGVPAQLLGVQESATYNNVAEAKLEFYEQTVIPEAEYIAQELSLWLSQQYSREVIVEFDKDQISALEPRRKMYWEKIENDTTLTINEKRQLRGYEPIPGGDELLVPANLIPIGIDLDTEEPNPDTDADVGVNPKPGSDEALADDAE